MGLIIFHEYNISVIGPKGHHHVNNSKFCSKDNDEAKEQALERVHAIIRNNEFSFIKHFNSFDIVVDYSQTIIEGEKYSFKRGDFN